MPIEIMPITLDHLKGYHACLDAVAKEKYFIALQAAPPSYLLRASVMENIQLGHPHCVALLDSELIGWCSIVRDELEAYGHNGTLGMGIQANFRGQGFGEKLLKATLIQAQKAGLERVELQVLASNQAAIGLYLKVGFEQEGRLKKRYCLNGQYQDLLQMALFIKALL
jgi:RimJ/RimL family protein N-acetyltransferase